MSGSFKANFDFLLRCMVAFSILMFSLAFSTFLSGLIAPPEALRTAIVNLLIAIGAAILNADLVQTGFARGVPHMFRSLVDNIRPLQDIEQGRSVSGARTSESQDHPNSVRMTGVVSGSERVSKELAGNLGQPRSHVSGPSRGLSRASSDFDDGQDPDGVVSVRALHMIDPTRSTSPGLSESEPLNEIDGIDGEDISLSQHNVRTAVGAKKYPELNETVGIAGDVDLSGSQSRGEEVSVTSDVTLNLQTNESLRIKSTPDGDSSKNTKSVVTTGTTSPTDTARRFRRMHSELRPFTSSQTAQHSASSGHGDNVNMPQAGKDKNGDKAAKKKTTKAAKLNEKTRSRFASKNSFDGLKNERL